MSKMSARMAGKKDIWDVLEILGKSIFGVVVTALLGVLTYKVNQQNADIASLNSQLQHESRSAEINIKRAEIAKTFFNELDGDNEVRKKLAIESLRVILKPDDAARLIAVVLENSSEADPSLKNYAEGAFNKVRSDSINGLYDSEPRVRIEAYQALVTNWKTDPALIETLIDKYEVSKAQAGSEISKQQYENGLYNTLVLMSHLDRDSVLGPKNQIIRNFANSLDGIGTETKERVVKLLSRLPT